MGKQKGKNYKGFRDAGIRLKEEALADLESNRHEVEKRILYAAHKFDKAHVVMLTEESIIGQEIGAKILNALKGMEEKGLENVRLEIGGGKHSGEKYLINKLGEDIGGFIHTARSSGDLGEVSNRIYQRDMILRLIEKLNQLRRIIINTAKEHINTIMPGYTHGQHAQPTSYGHYLLSWVCVFERDVSRLINLFEHIDESPAGAAILTGSDFPINRHRTAELLGFKNICKNTIDAILSYDLLLEFHCIISIFYANLLRLSDDIILWSTNEFNMIDIPDRFCGTSSIMMQKKNPEALEEIKGAGANAIGGMITGFHIEKGPTGIPIMEYHYSRKALYNSLDNALRNINWLLDLVPNIKVNNTLMGKRAGSWWAQATDIGSLLVRERNISWRTAHNIVSILTRNTFEKKIPPIETTTEMLDEAAIEYLGKPLNIPEELFNKYLYPGRFVSSRTLYGGPAPTEVYKRIEDYENPLQKDNKYVEDSQLHLAKSDQKLEEAVNSIIKL